MKKISLLFILSSFQLLLFAQSKTKWSVIASINPTISSTINSSVSSSDANQTYIQHNDSVSSKSSYRANVLIGTIWLNYSLERKWDFQFGLGYMDVGYQAQQSDIKYQTTIFSGIIAGDKLQELTNQTRNINYDYRFQYLHIPVLFNYLLRKSGDYRINYSFTCGAAVDVLLKHQVTANLLDGFNIDGKTTFNLSQTGYDARAVAFNLIVGGRIDYKIDKQMTLMVQPVVGFYPVSVTSSPGGVYPFYLSVNTGLIFDLAK